MASVQVHEYKVTMNCQGCSGAIEKVLNKMKDKGVEDVKINLEEQLVTVRSTLPAEDILEVIKKTGKQVEYLKSS